MIDRRTGQVCLGGESIGPGLTEEAFVGQWPTAKVGVENPPHRSYGIKTGLWNGGVYFSRGIITSVHLAVGIEGDSAGWAGRSEQNELRRKAKHDALLREWLGRPLPFRKARSFRWGQVASEYDARSGGSVIVVRYEARE